MGNVFSDRPVMDLDLLISPVHSVTIELLYTSNFLQATYDLIVCHSREVGLQC